MTAKMLLEINAVHFDANTPHMLPQALPAP